MSVNALLLAEPSTSRTNPAAAGVPAQLIALLDDTHLAQLVQTPSRLRYDPDFQMAGSDLRIDPPTVLCKPCRALMRDPPIITTETPYWYYLFYEYRSVDNEPPLGKWQAHHSSIFELIDCCSMLDGGCHLCQLFWYDLKEILHEFRRDSAQFSFIWPNHMLEVCIENYCNGHSIYLWTNLIFQSRHVLDPKIRRVSLFFEKPTEAPKYESSVLPSSTSTESKETFAKIASWIGECTQQHTTCQQQRGLAHERPTRLVAIENSGTRFRLEDKFPENTEYLALSYRWGRSDRALMLTSETIEKLTEWAPTSILSKTIQDACSIVNRLGLRYLWVDRLCIIQDSSDDWSHEASKMAHVYKQAFCTISAAGAPDEHGGCFMKRNTLGIRPLQLISSLLTNTDGYLLNRECFTSAREKGGYLINRGWAFQERMLSCRVLHFGRHQVHWECNKEIREEGHLKRLEITSAWERPIPDVAAIERYGKFKLWAAIVSLYTACDLTFERDKLPALSGMAQQMHQITLDEYLASMWRQDLIRELCWKTRKPASTFPATYRAPSWSWASHDGHIINVLPVSNEDIAPMAALSDCAIKLASENPFGEVQDAWIVLSCHLNIISFKAPTEPLDPDLGSVKAELRKEDEKAHSSSFVSPCHVKFDFSESLIEERATRMYSLPLYYDGAWSYSLLLVPLDTFGPINSSAMLIAPRTQNGREYRRLGLASMFIQRDREGYLKWFEKSPKKNVVIR